MSEFFAMGGYALFVWPCYAFTATGMIWLALHSWKTTRNNIQTLNSLQQQKG